MDQQEIRRYAGELLIASAACGLLDAFMIVSKLFETHNLVQYVPRSVWLWCLGLWLGLGAASIAIVLLLPQRWRAAAASLAVAGQVWLLIGVRLGRPLAAATHVPRTAVAVVVCFAWLLTARFVRFRKRAPGPSVRRRVALTLGLPAIVVVAVLLQLSESISAAAAMSGHPRNDAPNIVLVFLDTLRADTAQRMPNLQRFVQRGAVFDNAIAPAPWTLPSHVSAITGDSAAKQGITFERQWYEDENAVPRLLRRRGYDTAGVAANIFLNDGSGFTRGFRRYQIEGRGLDLCRAAPVMVVNRYWPAFQHNVCSASAADVIDSASRIIDTREGPLFLFLNFMDVHDLYYVPSPCATRAHVTLGDEVALTEALERGDPLEPRRAAQVRALYEDAAQCLDGQLAALFRRIDALPGRTITIITSDHGEQFGEHGLFMHGNSLYPELVHVPLAVVGSGIPQRRVSDPVSLTEIQDLVDNLTTGGREPSRLADLIAGRPAPLHAPTTVLLDLRFTVEKHPIAAVFDGRYEFIARRSGEDELYDLARDPATMHNLGADPAYADERQRLRTLLASENANDLVRKARRERMKNLRSVGYLH